NIKNYILYNNNITSNNLLDNSNTKQIKHTILQIGDNHQVFDAILNYIKENPTKGSYNYKIIKTDVKNLHEHVDKLLIYNVRIQLDDLEIEFKTDVIAEYTGSNEENKIKENKINYDSMIMTKIYREDLTKGSIIPEISLNKKK